MSWVAVAVGVGSAAVGAYSAHQQSKAANKLGKPTQLELEQAQNLRQVRPMASEFLKNGQQGLGQANSFWNSIARGGQAQALGILAPQLRQLDQQQQSAYLASQRLAPRGGGSAEGHLALMDSGNAQRNNGLLGLTTQAYDQLGQLGNAQAQIGGNLFTGAQQSGIGLIGAGQNRNSMAFDASRSAGQAYASALSQLGQIDWAKAFGSGGGTGNTTMGG